MSNHVSSGSLRLRLPIPLGSLPETVEELQSRLKEMQLQLKELQHKVDTGTGHLSTSLQLRLHPQRRFNFGCTSTSLHFGCTSQRRFNLLHLSTSLQLRPHPQRRFTSAAPLNVVSTSAAPLNVASTSKKRRSDNEHVLEPITRVTYIGKCR
jgi:hypothetical protein